MRKSCSSSSDTCRRFSSTAAAFRAQTFAHLRSPPFLEIFGQLPSLRTAAVSSSGSLFTWDFFKPSGANLRSLWSSLSGHCPGSAELPEEHSWARPARERRRPGWDISFDPVPHFQRRFPPGSGLHLQSSYLRVCPNTLPAGRSRVLCGVIGTHIPGRTAEPISTFFKPRVSYLFPEMSSQGRPH